MRASRPAPASNRSPAIVRRKPARQRRFTEGDPIARLARESPGPPARFAGHRWPSSRWARPQPASEGGMVVRRRTHSRLFPSAAAAPHQFGSQPAGRLEPRTGRADWSADAGRGGSTEAAGIRSSSSPQHLASLTGRGRSAGTAKRPADATRQAVARPGSLPAVAIVSASDRPGRTRSQPASRLAQVGRENAWARRPRHPQTGSGIPWAYGPTGSVRISEIQRWRNRRSSETSRRRDANPMVVIGHLRETEVAACPRLPRPPGPERRRVAGLRQRFTVRRDCHPLPAEAAGALMA